MSELLDTLTAKREQLSVFRDELTTWIAAAERGEYALVNAGCPQLYADELFRSLHGATGTLVRRKAGVSAELKRVEKRIAGLQRWRDGRAA